MSAAHDTEVSDPLLGQILQDRYRVVRLLGIGGMGAVYEGEHLLIKKRVAIKALHPQFATSADVVARFQQEALAATAIGHEHIIEVNDLGRLPDGALFMVLEYLAGRDFADLIEKEGPLSIGRAVHIVSQMCDALQAAHGKGIVHRDLKPENVFLIKRSGDPDFVKVLDFGISKVQDAEAGSSRGMTKTGAIMGTAYYMAPEQAMGRRNLDHRADIWALGVILFRALTRTYPFDDEAFPMLIVKVCSAEPPSLRALRPDAPEALEAVILRCMAKEPGKRYASCEALQQALLPFAAMYGAPVRGDGTSTNSLGTDPHARTALAPDSAAAVPVTALPVRAAATLPEAKSPKRPVAAIAIGAVVVVSLMVGAVALASGVGRSADTTSLVAVVPPTVASVVPAVGSAPHVATPAAPPIEFIVSPSEAAVLVDGHPIIADERGERRFPVAADDIAIHELRVEARGFKTRVEDLRLSYAQRIVTSLDPGTGVDDRRASSATGAGSPANGPGRHGRVTPPTVIDPQVPTTHVEPPVVTAVVQPHVEPPVIAPPPINPPAPPTDGVTALPPRRGLKQIRIP